MRIPSAKNWGEFAERESLTLFAQSIVEALFDHTVDSFKAPALNVHSLALEAHAIARDVVAERVSEGALRPVLEELLERLSTCPVISRRRGGAAAAYRMRLAPNTNAKNVVTALRAVIAELRSGYWEELCDALSAEIRGPQSARRIVDLAHAFICESERRGFTREDIYLQAVSFFFKPRRKRIQSADAIDQFLALFRAKEPEEYRVVFLGENGFQQAVDLCKRVDITVEVLGNDEDEFLKQLAQPGLETKLTVHKVKARDICRAREAAEERVQFAADIRRFVSHEVGYKWRSVGIVTSIHKNKTKTVKASTSPMLRGVGKKNPYSEISEQQLVEVFSGESLVDSSVRRIHSVFQYHRASMDASTPENQLLDLWAAIEGLTPTPGKDSARITHYVAQIIPSQTLTYSRKIFSYIDGSLRERPELAKLIDGVEQFNEGYMRTAAILCCEDLQSTRDELVTKLGSNPLLAFRTRKVREAFVDSERTRKTVEGHRKRVGWHIQRVYSSRNRIAHSASRLPHLETLVENLHAYVDTLISALIVSASRLGQRVDIETLLKVLEVHADGYMDDLKGDNRACRTENLSDIVFGASNPLMPDVKKALF